VPTFKSSLDAPTGNCGNHHHHQLGKFQ